MQSLLLWMNIAVSHLSAGGKLRPTALRPVDKQALGGCQSQRIQSGLHSNVVNTRGSLN